MFRLTLLLVVLGVANGAPHHKSPELDGRIVGGYLADIAKNPWQVSLQFIDTHFCGGILIAPTWVLTAAHCIKEDTSNDLNIRAGSASRSSGGQFVEVSRIFIHEGYNGDVSNDNDIAALQLAAPVTVATAKAATLPAAGAAIADGTNVTVTGWGAIYEQGISPDRLLWVRVPVVSHTQCRDAYALHEVTDNMFCAGESGKDSCQGDSGGPALADGIVIGIVSWGYGCGRPNYPGVYLKVSQYRNWIRQTCGV